MTSRDSAKSSRRSFSLYHTMWRRGFEIWWALYWARTTKIRAITPGSPIPPSRPSTMRRPQTTPLMWYKPRLKPFTQKKLRITYSLPLLNAKPVTLSLRSLKTHGSENCEKPSRSTTTCNRLNSSTNSKLYAVASMPSMCWHCKTILRTTICTWRAYLST